MLKKLSIKGFNWIDVDHPTKEDIDRLKKEFTIRNNVLERLVPTIKRSEIEEYKNYLFIILHFPLYDSARRQSQSAELDIIITKDALITSHNGNLSQHNDFFRNCNEYLREKSAYLGKGHIHLLYHLLDSLIDAQLPMLDHIADNIYIIEENVFKGKEKEMLREIAIVKRDIINFRRIIKPQHAILESLTRKAYRFSGAKNIVKLERHAQEVIGSNIKIWNTIENHKEMVESIEDTNESLLSYQLNETMKILTVVSVILAPMALIVNIWGMNVGGMPLTDDPFGFSIILLVMFLAGALLLVYFKNKKWM
ncbi:MAG: magnesium transporter CorA family protein [Patescibacteria group bacterium]|nr:magnesium transporter CorA family protein [Patescibacteria group bacterium]